MLAALDDETEELTFDEDVDAAEEPALEETALALETLELLSCGRPVRQRVRATRSE